jgi:hypothetical protein
MSYERSFVIGVFGRELLKRDGGVPDRRAGERVRFVRAVGNKTITLWTDAVLKAARTIYRQGAEAVSDRKRRELEGAI